MVQLSLDLVPNLHIYAGHLRKYDSHRYPDPRNYVFMNSFTSQRFETPYEFIDLAGIQFASGPLYVDNSAEVEWEESEADNDAAGVETPNPADENSGDGQFDDLDDKPPSEGSAGAVALTVAQTTPDKGDDTPRSYREDINYVDNEALVRTDVADDNDLF